LRAGEQLPGRVAELGSQIAHLRSEMHEEFSAVRGELRAIRGNGADLSLAKLHEEIVALRGGGGEGLTLAALRQEIRDGDDETRRLMRVLHEDVVQRIALLGEKPPSGSVEARRRTLRKKKGGKGPG
jgi:hypothetical protein